MKGIEKWIFDRIYYTISDPFLPMLLSSSITPNQITVFGFLVGVSGCVALAGKYFLIGIILIQLHMLIDNLDGGVAKAKDLTSFKGKFLDKKSHDVVFSLFFFCLAYGWSHSVVSLTLGFLASLGYCHHKFLKRTILWSKS